MPMRLLWCPILWILFNQLEAITWTSLFGTHDFCGPILTIGYWTKVEEHVLTSCLIDSFQFSWRTRSSLRINISRTHFKRVYVDRCVWLRRRRMESKATWIPRRGLAQTLFLAIGNFLYNNKKPTTEKKMMKSGNIVFNLPHLFLTCVL